MNLERLKIGFVSLGCPKNLVDTERMMAIVSAKGAVISGDQNDSDVVVINTCGFLEPAKEESMGTIKEFVHLKKKGKVRAVIVAGCMTERYLIPMQEAFPDIDAFIQTKDFSKIADVISTLQTSSDSPRLRLVGDSEQLSGHSDLPPRIERMPFRRPYAYVKISEGCNRACSFCIIPKLRGRLHSRPIEGIVDEIQQLVENGTTEILFIAQDLTSYGRDLGDGTNLLELLRAVERIDGLRWFRLHYNYPRFFTDDLIDHLAQSEKFTGYLDIPFQHISDRVLKRMRRPESELEIESLIEKLKAALPHLSLRTTLMVGFPGETELDFEKLLRFVEKTAFDQLGAFTYFREEGTPSFDMEKQVPEDVKRDRYDRLMKFQQKIQKKILESKVGSILPTMIDGLAEMTRQGPIYRGRHRGQAPEIDGMTYVASSRELQVGTIVDVEIQKFVGHYDLVGTPVAEAPKSESAMAR